MSDLVETRALGSRTSLELAGCRFVVTAGPDQGETCAVESSSLTIGSSANCDLVLTDGAVSRMHCELVGSDEGYRLRDLHSTNGTLVNGVRIVEAWVQPGDVLRLGESEISIEAVEDRLRIPLSTSDAFGPVLGRSLRMREIFHVLERVAAEDVTVLLVGETGTGKGLVARALHDASDRSGGPFVPVDCGALPDTLIESELFGHAKGAFTGATADRAGAFEQASGGTVFLDEIGELPPAQQTRLLRVLETHEIRRLGDNKARPLDLRVIAATNRPLAEDVEEGTFRKDLYYRLSVMEIDIPPLRERPEDIPLLAEKILEGLSEGRSEPLSLSTEAVDALQHHRWPGNVRELRNVLTRAMTLAGDAGEINTESVVLSSLSSSSASEGTAADRPWAEAQRSFERAYLQDLMRRHDGNVAQAAEFMGIHRQSLYRMLKRHALR